MPNSVLSVFVSSTAEDLSLHRDAVIKVIDRLGHKAVHMETFGARPRSSVKECCRLAERSDAFVLLVAHRYGWIPSVAEGGDGERSITWLESDAARRAQVPVFAFVVADDAPWTAKKEQDRLLDATDDQAALAVHRSIGLLRRFKKELAEQPWDRFGTPDDLATRVSTSLSIWFANLSEPRVESGTLIHPKLGLRLPLPEHWESIEFANNLLLLAPEMGGGFRSNMNVQDVPLDPGTDISGVLDENVRAFTTLGLQIESAEVGQIDGRQVAHLRYSGLFPGQAAPLCYDCLLCPRGSRQAVITATFLPAHREKLTQAVERAFAGLKFVPIGE